MWLNPWKKGLQDAILAEEAAVTEADTAEEIPAAVADITETKFLAKTKPDFWLPKSGFLWAKLNVDDKIYVWAKKVLARGQKDF